MYLILPDPPPKSDRSRRVSFGFTLARSLLRDTRRREGRYLLRSNLFIGIALQYLYGAH